MSLLVVIQRADVGYNEEHVVRWCSECGAVVVDVDYDGRTAAGRIMKMKVPSNSKVRCRHGIKSQ